MTERRGNVDQAWHRAQSEQPTGDRQARNRNAAYASGVAQCPSVANASVSATYEQHMTKTFETVQTFEHSTLLINSFAKFQKIIAD